MFHETALYAGLRVGLTCKLPVKSTLALGHKPGQMAGLVATGSDRGTIPNIFRGLSARNLQLTAATRLRDTLVGVVEFPILPRPKSKPRHATG